MLWGGFSNYFLSDEPRPLPVPSTQAQNTNAEGNEGRQEGKWGVPDTCNLVTIIPTLFFHQELVLNKLYQVDLFP